jgi:hypothetical protein
MSVDDDALRSAGGDATVLQPAPGGASRGMRAWVPERLWRHFTPERVVVVVLGLLVLVVHDVGYLLRQPFWNDEAWVAVTTRFPLSQLPATTSATPIGWSVLIRVFTPGGDQTSRLLPLAFAGGAVAVAYWFARRLDWPNRNAAVTAGVLAALGVLLAPAMLVRNDLKQYTTDAFFALLTFSLTSRLERAWSRRSLAGLSLAIWGGMLFSHTVAFVGAAALGALCLVQLARRAWRQLAEATVAAAVTGVLMLAVYTIFDARAVSPGLTAYWRRYYLPVHNGVHGVRFVASRFNAVHIYFGLGPVWLAVPLVVAGLVTIVQFGRPATALAAAVLWPEMLAVSALKKYPFLDLRTSTFLIAVTIVVAAIGLAGACTLLQPRAKGAAAAGLAALAVTAFAMHAQPFARKHTLPLEDVRGQARYVAAHAAPNDVILVNLNSNWGFGYYWPVGHPSHRPDPAVLQGYEAYFPDQPRIIVAQGRTSRAVDAALTDAITQARAHPGAQIWLVQAHVNPSELAGWKAALHQHGLIAVPTGGKGLSVAHLTHASP